MIKILAFAATNHQNSINKKLVQYALQYLQQEAGDIVDIDLIDLIDYELPLYRQDREDEDGIPSLAADFYNKITQADAIIISFAEHNSSYTAVYKNLFDWASRINRKTYQNKPMMIMSASPGCRGGLGVLGAVTNAAASFAMDIISTISVPLFHENYDITTAEITDAEIAQAIQNSVKALLAKTIDK